MSLKMKALEFATKAHSGQTRKGNGIPYISHPIKVGEILEEAGFSEEVVAAGYLHDVVEDTGVTIEEIEELFGKKVAFLVRSHTEDKSKSWEERKQHTIDTVKQSSIDVKALIAADKLHNLRSLVEDYLKNGDKLWSIFNRGFEKQKWYHLGIANNLENGLNESETPTFFKEFIEEANSFFNR